MSTRTEKVKAGIFVLISVFLMVVILALVVGLRVLKTTRVYYVRFQESVTGLEESSTVRYYGVPVGRVADIGFSKGTFPEIEVTIEVDVNAPVRTDTIALLKPQGITGLYYIDLEQGSKLAPRLKEGGRIKADVSFTVQIMDTLENIRGVVQNLNDILTENREGIAAAVVAIEGAATEARKPIQRLDQGIADAVQVLKDLRVEFSTTADEAKQALRTVREFVSSGEMTAVPEKLGVVLDRAEELLGLIEAKVNDADVGGVVASVEKVLATLEGSGANLNGALSDIRGGVQENRGNLMRIMGDFQTMSATLKRLARELREDPSRLFFGGGSGDRKEER